MRPQAAPGELFVIKAATRRSERQTSAVAAARCFGGVINTSLQHRSHQ